MRQQEVNRLEASRPTVRPSLAEHVAFLQQQMDQTRQAIRRHIDSHPPLRSRRDLLTPIPSIAEKTAAQGKRPMVIVGAAMRKLLPLAYGVVNTGRPFDPC